ncbi:MAG: hypothetical protein NVS2B14_19410 [Chamaesiphon sp.]
MKLAEDSLAPSSQKSVSTTELTIEGIVEPLVLRYFDTLNAGDFQATATLFADLGTLYPLLKSLWWDQRRSPLTYKQKLRE